MAENIRLLDMVTRNFGYGTQSPVSGPAGRQGVVQMPVSAFTVTTTCANMRYIATSRRFFI
ncbi:MAG: hypothetical protein HQL08_11725 [Nitrospirae bacterium]|nr:hypothetical protein [Nitrospirota bacterium]